MRFPVSAEAILQREELHENERWLLAAWLPVFNDIYQSGRTGEPGGLAWLLERIERRRQGCSSGACHFLNAAAFFAAAAWSQGYREAQV